MTVMTDDSFISTPVIQRKEAKRQCWIVGYVERRKGGKAERRKVDINGF